MKDGKIEVLEEYTGPSCSPSCGPEIGDVVWEEYTGPSCSPSCGPEIGDVVWGEPPRHWRLKLAARWVQFAILTVILIFVVEVPVCLTANFLGVTYKGPILSMALAAVVRDCGVALILLWLWWGIKRLRCWR